MSCVHQENPQATLRQNFIDRQPINTGRLHRDRVDAAPDEPVGHLLHILGETRESTHGSLVSIGRHRDIMGGVADVNARRVGVYHVEVHRALAFLGWFAHLALLLAMTSASPVATGLKVSSTGSKPPRKRSHENRSHALLRAHRAPSTPRP